MPDNDYEEWYMCERFYKPTLRSDRPISQEELRDIRHDESKRMDMSYMYAVHTDCKHFYRLSNTSRRLKLRRSDQDMCLVCWRLRMDTDGEIRKIVDDYYRSASVITLNIDTIVDESMFYMMLYRLEMSIPSASLFL